jgi:hypothetical protein
MILNKEAILSTVPVLTKEEVYIPEWDGSVYVRVLRSGEKDALEAKFTETKNKNFRARLVVAVVCDEHGEKLFKEADILVLAQHSAAALEPIVEAAMRLNRWTKTDIESLEKNSENGQYEDS